MRLRMGEPVRIAVHVGIGLGQIGHAALRQADIHVGLGRELPPERVRFDHDGQLVRVTALLANPAPVSAGLLARDPALLQQHDP